MASRRGIRTGVLGMLMSLAVISGAGADGVPPYPKGVLLPATEFPGERSEWEGFRRHDFTVDGRACLVVDPKIAAPGKPWIWRARFFGHEPQTDIALLNKGFHLVYMDVAGLFGNPAAVAHWNAFYDYLTGEHGFARKAALEGMSRGGLIIFNWAAANPDKVACIYADAPVCDIKSWPGGKGAGTGNPEEWEACLKAYGFTEEQALAYPLNPIDNLEPLARAGIPLFHVCGGADTGVPVAENTAIVEERYKKLGGNIEVIIKEECGHHPHSLVDPAPIVDFILKYAGNAGDYFALRGGLGNARIQFAKERKGRVAFLGGSITEGNGWRNKLCEDLQRRFPETDFDFINAGIASTDSTLAPFRLQTDVFAQGQVDLLFVEFAVNDDTNTRAEKTRGRGMEGVVRQARQTNPDIDIVFQYFVDPEKMRYIEQGEILPVIATHEQVAQHYGIPAINLAWEVTARIHAGEFDWEKFGGLHPGPFGHELYARTEARLLDTAWSSPLPEAAAKRPYRLPKAPLDPQNYERARYVGPDKAEISSGWKLVASWDTKDGQNRGRFRNIPILEAISPDAELKLAFSGTAIGLYVLAGPDVGILEFSIDDGPAQRLDLFTQWSPNLHIPWAYMLDADLAPGEHTLTLRTTNDAHPKSRGHAARIVKFLVN